MNKFKKILPLFLLASFIVAGAFYVSGLMSSGPPTGAREEKGTLEGQNENMTATTEEAGEMLMPDLDRKIVVPDYFPLEAKQIAKEKINALTRDIKDNPDYFNGWVELGIYRKMINDYEGTRDIWEYASFIRPQNSISFANLGDLYGYYLKEPQKAEANYKKAIENGPEQVMVYYNFHKFYIDVLNDTAKARAVLQQGISANPDNSDTLKQALELLP